MNYLSWFSDNSINEFLTIVFRDYKFAAVMIGGPVFFFLRWLVKKTPWKSDDQLEQALERRLGVSLEKEQPAAAPDGGNK